MGTNSNNMPKVFLDRNQVIILDPPQNTDLNVIDITTGQLLKNIDKSDIPGYSKDCDHLLENINLIYNSDFSEGTTYWQAEQRAKIDFSHDIAIGELILENGHTAYISQDGSEQDGNFHVTYNFNPTEDNLIPLLPNREYQVSGYFGMHRCNGILQLELFSKQRKLLQVLSIQLPVESNCYGGKSLDGYFLAKEIFHTGDKIAYGRLTVIKCNTILKEKNKDSFLFFTRLFLGTISSSEDKDFLWKKSIFTPEALKQLLIGKSKKYLSAKLPTSIADGKSHNIQIVNSETGEVLNSQPIVYQKELLAVAGEIEKIENSHVIGWTNYDFSDETISLNLLVDGILVANSIANLSHKKFPGYGFRLVIPASYLDGRVHHFVIEDDQSGVVIDETVTITDYVSTPWDILQKYSNPPFPAYLAPMASDRYNSLQMNLNAFSQADVSVEFVKNLSFLHEQLIKGFERKQKEYVPLNFPLHKKPLVSVIIPVHNKFAVTYNCLVALLFAYNRVNFEVIVVDDGSEDDTLDLPDLITGITYLRHETAQGFILSCNLGAKSAKGEYLVFLNNDTEPVAKWLDEMLFVFENFDNVGLVGSKLVYPNGELQEAGGIVWETGDPWNYGRQGNAHDPKYNYTRQVDYVSGASLMIPRQLWSEVDGFSQEFCPAYFEDTDLSFKVKALGKRVVYTPFSKVYHYEGISSGTSVSSGTKRYQEVNRPKFKKKWSNLYQNNGELGKKVDFNKDRGIRYRALFIDLETPRPDQDAGSYAAVQEIRLFQSLGFKVTFIPENLAYLGNYTDNLQRLGVEIIYAPFYLTVEKFLEERGEEFDVVYITRYNCVEKHLVSVREYAPQAKVVFCNADLHFLRVIREAIYQKEQSRLEDGIKIRDIELRLMQEVDVTLSYNTVEHSVVLSHNLEKTNIVTCPWVVDISKEIVPFEQRQNIAFLGGFRHHPNLDAVKFFIQSVMPLIRQKLTGVNFLVYGSNPPKELEKMASDDIFIKGYVESVGEVYDTCRVFVAPLLFGAGVKGKVVDALAHGVPQVLSPVAAEGTGVRDGLEVYIAQKPEEWAEKIIKLYNDQKLWENMAKSSQEYAKVNFSFHRGRELMGEALETVEIYPNYDQDYFVYRQAR